MRLALRSSQTSFFNFEKVLTINPDAKDDVVTDDNDVVDDDINDGEVGAVDAIAVVSFMIELKLSLSSHIELSAKFIMRNESIKLPQSPPTL